jgi:uncharacterized protein YlaN (UPF0358 family)
MPVKDKDNLDKRVGPLKEEEVNTLLFVQSSIEELLEKEAIDEDGLRVLENLERELSVIRTNYTRRIIRLLKHDGMV